jgi:hypothetical protein
VDNLVSLHVVVAAGIRFFAVPLVFVVPQLLVFIWIFQFR